MGIKNGKTFFCGWRPGDPNTAVQTPEMQSALRTVKGVLAELELRIIEFFSEWLVALLMPARHVLEITPPLVHAT